MDRFLDGLAYLFVVLALMSFIGAMLLACYHAPGIIPIVVVVLGFFWGTSRLAKKKGWD